MQAALPMERMLVRDGLLQGIQHSLPHDIQRAMHGTAGCLRVPTAPQVQSDLCHADARLRPYPDFNAAIPFLFKDNAYVSF